MTHKSTTYENGCYGSVVGKHKIQPFSLVANIDTKAQKNTGALEILVVYPS